MSAIINMFRVAVAALALTFLAPGASAARPTPPSRTVATELAPSSADTVAPAGSPEFGLLIIIGAVVFLFFVAWLFTRVGDDSGPRGDGFLN